MILLWPMPRKHGAIFLSFRESWNRISMEMYRLTIHELQKKIRAGETTASDIIADLYRRIEKVEGAIHAYITLTKESAFEQAGAADELIKKGEIKELAGIPIALKDILCTRGVRT